MRHQSQKGLRGIFFGIQQQHKGKGYLINVPITQKIVSSHDFVFYKNVSSALAYMSCPHSVALATRSSVLYITYATSHHEQTSEIITFAQF